MFGLSPIRLVTGRYIVSLAVSSTLRRPSGRVYFTAFFYFLTLVFPGHLWVTEARSVLVTATSWSCVLGPKLRL